MMLAGDTPNETVSWCPHG